jgi:hypothetical protein
MWVFGCNTFRAGLLAGCLLATTAAAAEPAPVVSRHQVQVAGHPLAYTAEAGRVPIRDVQTGEPLGHVAYRAPAAPGKVRPITFIWNGGPGMPAASLHFEGAGPRRVEGDRLLDNPDTWLTDSDLVFMDPVATGFSRAVSSEAEKAFTSWIGDVAATTEFVRSWVLLHGAEDAPETARAIAEHWARETYLPALRRIDQLTDAERTAMAADLARHIGLKASDIDPKTLRVTQGFFLGHIGSGKRLYYSDLFRLPVRRALQGAAPGAGDPLHPPRPGLRQRPAHFGVEPIEDGFAPDGVYPKPINSRWTHSTVYGATPEQIAQAQADFAKQGGIGMGKFGPSLPGAADAITLNPALKVLVAHGAYDPLGGCSMDAELGRRLASPHREAVTFRC